MKLEKSFFNVASDVYIGITYFSPYGSADPGVIDDLFESLRRDVSKYSKLGFCFIGGDFNARTNSIEDFIPLNDDKVINEFMHDTDMDWARRRNRDQHATDNYGKRIIDFCKEVNVRILNGRILGDQQGDYTCFAGKNPSVIDYLLCNSPELISFMRVHDPGVHSDHCMLSCTFKSNVFKVPEETEERGNPVHKFMWREGDNEAFRATFESHEISSNVRAMLAGAADMGLDEMTDKATETIIKAAELARIRKTGDRKVKRKSNKTFFDGECRKVRTELRRLIRQLRANPNIQDYHTRVLFCRRKYRGLLSRKRQQFKDSITERMESIYHSDPKTFWNLFNQLNEATGPGKCPIGMSEWVKFFQQALNTQAKLPEGREEFFVNFVEQNSDSIFNELNFAIQIKELIEAIGHLKWKKASNQDMVLNEMLKAGGPPLHNLLLVLYNKVLLTGDFPKLWHSNILWPLHKKGPKTDPNNYRAISIGSNMGKLFCLILQRRLSKFAEKHGLVPECQIGYQSGCRTSDHILALRTMVDKYVKCVNGGKLFTCFVDFKSAFPSVCQSALFYKLLESGVGGNFLHCLKSMYKSICMNVRMGQELGPDILVSGGLKQGCVLSPLLFNIFTRDLPSIFDDTCSAPLVGGSPVGCLMYADDLVLMSTTSKGLQNALDRLGEYCRRWGLTVNEGKTKVMIFSNSTRRESKEHYTYLGRPLEIADEYVYLGIVFTPNCGFTKALERLYEQARKAFFKLRQLNIRNSVRTTLILFNSLVLPILLYGCEVWGPCQTANIDISNLYGKCHKIPGESLVLQFCKLMLGVNRKASNIAVRGEIGQFPILIYASKHFIKYWWRLNSIKPSTFLGRIYGEAREIYGIGRRATWFKGLSDYLRMLEPGNRDFAGPTLQEVTNIKRKLLRNHRDIFEKVWRTQLLGEGRTGNSKLRTYKQFKKTFAMEKYLLFLPFHKRRSITRLRISSHNLAIEKGRHCRTELENRICTICASGEIEDEYHHVIKCAHFAETRKEFREAITEITGEGVFSTVGDFNKLMELASQDCEIATLFSDYLTKLGHCRELALSRM